MTKSELRKRHSSFFHVFFFFYLGPVKPSLPSPAGDVVKYSSQLSDHIIPSQDLQGI